MGAGGGKTDRMITEFIKRASTHANSSIVKIVQRSSSAHFVENDKAFLHKFFALIFRIKYPNTAKQKNKKTKTTHTLAASYIQII